MIAELLQSKILQSSNIELNKGEWIMVNILIGGTIIGTAAYIVIKNTKKIIKGETSCGHNCSSCSMNCNNRNDVV